MKDFFTQKLPAICLPNQHTRIEAGYALPDSTLSCLKQIVQELGIKSVFEFGSGKSTKMFLDCGCNVTSLEDSETWRKQMISTLSEPEQQRLVSLYQQLSTVFHQFVPFRGWRIYESWEQNLKKAELILIDSPAYPPFREHALLTALNANSTALIVLDDVNIPTVRRFCERLVSLNPQLLNFFADIDHGLFFVAKSHSDKTLRTSRGLIEWIKAWRRFLIAPNK